MGNAWNHGFKPGDHIPTSDVLAACERRIESGEVESPEGKRIMLDVIRNYSHETLVFTPKGKGWGASPMNPNSWSRLDGQPIWTQTTISGTKRKRA